METYTHKCLSENCQNTYADTDPDAYYCESCQKKRKDIAAEIDKKFQGRSTEPVHTALDEYEENSVVVNGMRLMKVKL